MSLPNQNEGLESQGEPRASVLPNLHPIMSLQSFLQSQHTRNLNYYENYFLPAGAQSAEKLQHAGLGMPLNPNYLPLSYLLGGPCQANPLYAPPIMNLLQQPMPTMNPVLNLQESE